MKKLYVVIEEFGEFPEDSLFNTIGICKTRELADKLAAISKKYYTEDGNISRERWMELEMELDAYIDKNEDYDKSGIEIMHMLHPELSIKDLKEADEKYDSYAEYAFTSVYEVNVYETEEDLNNYYKTKGEISGN